MAIDISLLGPVQVMRDGEALSLKGRRRLTLLAALALGADRRVSRDRLVDSVWGEDPPSKPHHALEVLVSRLRQSLDPDGETPAIITVGNGYALNHETVEVDVRRFQRLVAQARGLKTADPARASALLGEALGLWRGPVLDGVDIPTALLPTVTELEELRHSALEDRFDAEIDSGRHGEIIGELQSLVAEHPFRERTWELLMVALYRSGRQAEALRAYQEAREHLGDSLGIEPGPGLRDLEEKILFQDESIRPIAPRRANHNVPVPTNSLVGRLDELKMIDKLLETGRLVTLVGPGGVGKTRLAIATGRRLVDDDHETWFIDLTQLKPGDDLIWSVAATIGLLNTSIDDVPVAVAAAEILAPYVANRPVTFILDNCEHLVDDAAQAAFDLLRMGPEVGLLATSREALRVPAERVYETPPFAVDGDAAGSAALSHAVQLFVDRASSASSTFELTEVNHRHVADICRRLDGVPLSIELAAAQTNVFDLAEIAAHLERSVTSLDAGFRTADPRHQSLRAAIEWSHELLSEDARRLLAHLSVFGSTFDLAALEALLPGTDARTHLGELVRKSVVQSEPVSVGSRRYRLLEAVREFAAERLDLSGERAQIEAGHAAVFAARAEQAWATSETEHARANSDALLLDIADLRSALQWFSNHDADGFLSMAGSLGWFFDAQGMTGEGTDWLDRALAATLPTDSRERARALHASLLVSMWTSDVDRHQIAGERGQEAYEMYGRLGDGAGRARALLTLARIGWGVGAGTIPYKYGDATKLYRSHGTKWGLAWALYREGQDLFLSNDALEAGRPYELISEAAAIFAKLGDRLALAETTLKKAWASQHQFDRFVPPHLSPREQAAEEASIEEALLVLEAEGGSLAAGASYFRADWAMAGGDFVAAERHVRRTIAALEERGLFGKVEMSELELALGWALRGRGDPAGAAQAFERSGRDAVARGHDGALVASIEATVTIAVDLGLHELAAQIHGAASGFRRRMAEGPYRETGYDMPRWDVPRYEASLDRALEALGPERFDTAVTDGAGWTLIEAKEHAVATISNAAEGP